MKITWIFIIVFLQAFSAICQYASMTRLNSLSAAGYIPDYEYDAININPAFILDSDKAGVSAYSGIELKNNSDVYNNRIKIVTNTSSVESNILQTTTINPTFFINIPVLTNLEIGFYYNPVINSSYSYSYVNSNSWIPYSAEQVINGSISAPLSLNLFIGLNPGNIKAGIEYTMIMINSSISNESKTNGILLTNNKIYGENSYSVYGGKAGVVYSQGNLDAGFCFGFNYDTLTLKNTNYYFPLSNFFIGQDNGTGYVLNPVLFFQYKTEDFGTLRIVFDGSYSSTSVETVINKNNAGGINPSYYTDYLLNNYKIHASDSYFSGKLSMSVFKGEPQFNLWYAGLKLTGKTEAYSNNTYATPVKDPTGSGQKFISNINGVEIGGSISTGFEGRVISLFIPRIGLTLNVFDYTYNETKVIDSYNNLTGLVEDTNTVNSRTAQYTLFNNAVITAGLGYMPSENVLIEAGINGFIGLGIFNKTVEPDLTQGTSPKETVSSLDFSLFLNISGFF